MKKPRLMTPGPAPVPEDVLTFELARPVIHHRSAEAKEVVKEVVEGLKYVFQTKTTCMIDHRDRATVRDGGRGGQRPSPRRESPRARWRLNAVPPGGKAIVLNGAGSRRDGAKSATPSASTPSTS